MLKIASRPGCNIRRPRTVLVAIALAFILLAFVGCVGPGADGPAPAPPTIAEVPCQPGHDLTVLGEQVRAAQQPAVIPPHRTVLVLSGGGVYGAYSAGVLCGWTDAGTRPTFDVVTGISTGALISVFAFLGPEYDAELRCRYTTVKASDIYHWKLGPWALLSDSVTRNNPLRRQIEEVITPDVVMRIADAHCHGRRLYIGTTDMETRKPVVWDIGAIAASGQPDSRELICKIMLASASIPGLFPPVEIACPTSRAYQQSENRASLADWRMVGASYPVATKDPPREINGGKCVERHQDGGLTAPLFFRPPASADDKRNAPLAESCFGSDVYVVIAQKLYLDCKPVSPHLPSILGNSAQTFLAAQRRDAVIKVYLQSIFSGMHFQVTAIPSGFQGPKTDIDFDTVAMTKLFEEGRRQVLAGTAWSATPPGFGADELLERSGTR